MCSPTTSPYGYSSFPKEEIGNTIDFLVSLSCDGTDLLVIFVKPGNYKRDFSLAPAPVPLYLLFVALN